MQAEPTELDGVHTYVYVGDDPIDLSDPWGMGPCDGFLAGACQFGGQVVAGVGSGVSDTLQGFGAIGTGVRDSTVAWLYDPRTARAQWAANGALASYVWNNKGAVAKGLVVGIVSPCLTTIKSGNVGRAIGRCGFDVALFVIGPKGLTKLGDAITGLRTLPTVGRYGDLTGSLERGFQANHLNQAAAFRGIIPSNDAIAIPLRGDAIRDVGSPHYLFHKSLEGFWNQFRKGGARSEEKPTNSEYGRALYVALRAAGFSPRQATYLAQLARADRIAHGLTDNALVPNIPHRMGLR